MPKTSIHRASGTYRACKEQQDKQYGAEPDPRTPAETLTPVAVVSTATT